MEKYSIKSLLTNYKNPEKMFKLLELLGMRNKKIKNKK